MRGKGLKPTQEDKILALLQAEQKVRDMRLMAACKSGEYQSSISRLRSKGHRIIMHYTLEGNYYQLIQEGENDGRTTNITTELQAA